MTASPTTSTTPEVEETSTLRCGCHHITRRSAERCGEPAAFDVATADLLAVLCVECLESWREADRHRYGEVRLTAREL